MEKRNVIISRIRGILKAAKQDAFLTDRFIYALVKKHAPFLMKREDGRNKLMAYVDVFRSLPYVELVEVNRIEAGCKNIPSDCKIKKTKEKLPGTVLGYFGPLISSVTSISGTPLNPTDEYPIEITTPLAYQQLIRVKSHKYNKKRYCWFLNGHLYFPNLEWDAVRIVGIFDDNIDEYNCADCGDCTTAQEQPFFLPEHLYSELESLILKDLGITMQIPPDVVDNKQNILR